MPCPSSASDLAEGPPGDTSPLDTEETEPAMELVQSEADDHEDSGGHSIEVSWPPVPATWTEMDPSDDQQRLALLLGNSCSTDDCTSLRIPHQLFLLNFDRIDGI